MLKEIQDLEIFNQQVVKDHVDALSTHELEERRQQEELEQVRQENAAMREQIRQATFNTKKTKTKAKNEYIADTMEYQEKFRDQAKIQQENIAIIKDQYRKVQEIYKRKTEEMTERLKADTTKVENTERRRKLELEGYSADLQNMKKKIEFYQKYITKLKALVEEDRGVADLFTNLRNDDIREAERQEEEGDSPVRDGRTINIESNTVQMGM